MGFDVIVVALVGRAAPAVLAARRMLMGLDVVAVLVRLTARAVLMRVDVLGLFAFVAAVDPIPILRHLPASFGNTADSRNVVHMTLAPLEIFHPDLKNTRQLRR